MNHVYLGCCSFVDLVGGSKILRTAASSRPKAGNNQLATCSPTCWNGSKASLTSARPSFLTFWRAMHASKVFNSHTIAILCFPDILKANNRRVVKTFRSKCIDSSSRREMKHYGSSKSLCCILARDASPTLVHQDPLLSLASCTMPYFANNHRRAALPSWDHKNAGDRFEAPQMQSLPMKNTPLQAEAVTCFVARSCVCRHWLKHKYQTCCLSACLVPGKRASQHAMWCVDCMHPMWLWASASVWWWSSWIWKSWLPCIAI